MPNQGSIHTCTATIYEMLLPGMSKGGQGRTDKDADGRAWMGVEWMGVEWMGDWSPSTPRHIWATPNTKTTASAAGYFCFGKSVVSVRWEGWGLNPAPRHVNAMDTLA